MTKTATILFLLAITSSACAVLPQAGVPRATRDLLTPQEFPSDCHWAYQAIQRLRPRWLLARGPVRAAPSTEDYPQVVVDGMRMGDLRQLRSIPLEGVREMRFLSSGEATLRHGSGYPAGAIEVTMGGR